MTPSAIQLLSTIPILFLLAGVLVALGKILQKQDHHGTDLKEAKADIKAVATAQTVLQVQVARLETKTEVLPRCEDCKAAE